MGTMYLPEKPSPKPTEQPIDLALIAERGVYVRQIAPAFIAADSADYYGHAVQVRNDEGRLGVLLYIPNTDTDHLFDSLKQQAEESK